MRRRVSSHVLTEESKLMADDRPTGLASPSLACSVGIMAYNEAANVATAIQTILHQHLMVGHVAELIVVASGCTDATPPRVAALARDEARVRLLVQERRDGKASAINLFLGAARAPLLLLVGADVLVKEGTIAALLRHFEDPRVGMVGGQPLPVNDAGTFLGHTVHLLWRVHDRVARAAPKLGEVVAFRNVVPRIPLDACRLRDAGRGGPRSPGPRPGPLRLPAPPAAPRLGDGRLDQAAPCPGHPEPPERPGIPHPRRHAARAGAEHPGPRPADAADHAAPAPRSGRGPRVRGGAGRRPAQRHHHRLGAGGPRGSGAHRPAAHPGD